MDLRRHPLTILVLALLTTPLLNATSSHTWVSGAGSDSNTGTRTSPFATFQTAVDNTTAGGIVSVIDPGDFGPVSISKAITIDGGGARGTISFTGAQGVFVFAGASDTVVLRHLTINGLGTGNDAIFYSTGQNLIVEDCVMENFTQIGLGVGSGTALNLVVRNSVITGGTLGLRVFQGVGPGQISVRGVAISGASQVGVFIRSGLTEISDSIITQNLVGLEADSGSTINVANSVISYNGTDSISFPPANILLSNNNTIFANNGTGSGLSTTLGFGGRPKTATYPDDKPRPNRQ